MRKTIQPLLVYCMKKSGFYIALLFCFSYVSLRAQTFDRMIDIYTQKNPAERMYFHFDKSMYTAGETVWFKIYLRNGIDPTMFSKNVYVDFSDETGKVLSHSFFPIVESSARGQFLIPKNFEGTAIQIKAYTRWMLNFDSAMLYSKVLKIIPKDKYNKYIKPQPLRVDVTAFPEGGNAVVNVNSRIAFKATDQYGKPVNISGKVVNTKGVVLANATVQHDGMGLFNLKPLANEQYFIEWNTNEGIGGKTPIDNIVNEGVQLRVESQKEKCSYTIERTANTVLNGDVTVVGMMYNRLVYMAHVSLKDKPKVRGVISYKDFPSGILQLSVLDEQKKPLAERITFVKNDSLHFNAEVGFVKLATEARGENEIALNVTSDVPANLSLSVIDGGISHDGENNIFSGLLLTSQIKGRVNNPAYYFSKNDSIVNSHLDLVMLTNGWRKYDWVEIAKGIQPAYKYAPDTSFLFFNGKVFATPQQIAIGGDLMAILKEKNDTSKIGGNNFLVLPINKDGTFEDRDLSFMDSIYVYYSFSNKNSPLKYSEVVFLNNKMNAPTKILMDEKAALATKDINSEEQRDRYFATLNFAAEEKNDLADVVVVGVKKSAVEKLDESYASGVFKGDGYQFDILNDPFASASVSIFQYLESRVPGLQITNAQSSQPTLSWRGMTPALFLDQMPVDESFLSTVNVNDIAYVKVFRPPFLGAIGGGAGGAIAVYSRRGDDARVGPSKSKLPFKIIEGYTVMKEFYHPNYLSLQEKHETQDIRSTLFWQPLILTNKFNKMYKFKFFNNDVSKSFRIVLEGIDAEGKMIHVEKVIK